MLYFDPAIIASPVRELTEGRTSSAELSYPAIREPASATCFLSLFRAMTDMESGNSDIEVQENLLLLLSRLIERRDQEPLGAPIAVDLARERINDDPTAPLSLRELAAIGGISQFQLVRGFSKVTGLTPHAYLVQRRLQLARRMIADGAALTNAALASGFADQSHMTRLFTRTYGISPGLYAAAIR
ncbi:AraC-type DNA-binding protein [Rhizobium sp. NFR07]|nr:AraC-type DNA-binding protein [Rhizobium sp. NFR07]